jgi:hypothetical protein
MGWDRERTIHDGFLWMVIDDRDINRPSTRPHKADTVLVVDPNRVLPSSIASQGFEPISRRHTELIEVANGIQYSQFIESFLTKHRRQEPSGAG